MKFTKRNYIFLFLSVGVMAIIFWFSSRDATASTEQSDFFITVFLNSLFEGDIPHWLSVVVRKAAHFTVYAILGACLFNSFEGAVDGVLRPFGFALVGSMLYAVSDEVHQIFVPGRAGRVFDFFIDSFGALCGIGVALLLLFIIGNIKEKRSCR